MLGDNGLLAELYRIRGHEERERSVIREEQELRKEERSLQRKLFELGQFKDKLAREKKDVEERLKRAKVRSRVASLLEDGEDVNEALGDTYNWVLSFRSGVEGPNTPSPRRSSAGVQAGSSPPPTEPIRDANPVSPPGRVSRVEARGFQDEQGRQVAPRARRTAGVRTRCTYCGEDNHRSVHCYDPHIGCERDSCNVADTHRSYQPKYRCRASTTYEPNVRHETFVLQQAEHSARLRLAHPYARGGGHGGATRGPARGARTSPRSTARRDDRHDEARVRLSRPILPAGVVSADGQAITPE